MSNMSEKKDIKTVVLEILERLESSGIDFQYSIRDAGSPSS